MEIRYTHVVSLNNDTTRQITEREDTVIDEVIRIFPQGLTKTRQVKCYKLSSGYIVPYWNVIEIKNDNSSRKINTG